MLGSYSKLIGSIIGALVGIILGWLATKGLATCAPGPDGTEACVVTALGLSLTSAQITGALTTACSALFTYFFPANKPPS